MIYIQILFDNCIDLGVEMNGAQVDDKTFSHNFEIKRNKFFF